MMKATKQHTVVHNTLNRKFKQGLVGKVLLTDITYLTYGTAKRVYLSTIKDVMTNEITKYKMDILVNLDDSTKENEEKME